MPAIIIALFIGALALTSLMGYLIIGKINRTVSAVSVPYTSYSPSDVVYGQPLHVVHQMDSVVATTPITASENQALSKPQLRAPETFFDFGHVRTDQVVTHVFEIANQGSAPLLFTAAHTTCACTTADLTTTVVPPGKIGLMTVRFDPSVHNLSGQTVRRGVIIETNDPQNPSVDFWIQATVR